MPSVFGSQVDIAGQPDPVRFAEAATAARTKGKLLDEKTLLAIKPMYWTRLVGGLMYLTGFLIMAWNLIMTAKSGTLADDEIEVTEVPEEHAGATWTQIAFGKPVLFGPHTFNFLQATDDAVAAGAALRVADAEELVAVVARMLGGLDELRKMRASALSFAQVHRGATARTVALIRSALTS